MKIKIAIFALVLSLLIPAISFSQDKISNEQMEGYNRILLVMDNINANLYYTLNKEGKLTPSLATDIIVNSASSFIEKGDMKAEDFFLLSGYISEAVSPLVEGVNSSEIIKGILALNKKEMSAREKGLIKGISLLVYTQKSLEPSYKKHELFPDQVEQTIADRVFSEVKRGNIPEEASEKIATSVYFSAMPKIDGVNMDNIKNILKKKLDDDKNLKIDKQVESSMSGVKKDNTEVSL